MFLVLALLTILHAIAQTGSGDTRSIATVEFIVGAFNLLGNVSQYSSEKSSLCNQFM